MSEEPKEIKTVRLLDILMNGQQQEEPQPTEKVGVVIAELCERANVAATFTVLLLAVLKTAGVKLDRRVGKALITQNYNALLREYGLPELQIETPDA